MDAHNQKRPLLARIEKLLRTFALLIPFYMLPLDAVKKLKLEAIPRNPLAFISDEDYLALYRGVLFERKMMNLWGSMIWENLDIRGKRLYYSKRDPMRTLVQHSFTWVDVLEGMGFDARRLAMKVLANGEAPYFSAEESERIFLEMANRFWTHRSINAKGIYEFVCKHRILEDFSKTFSHAKIDCYRSFYHTQSKVSVVTMTEVDIEREKAGHTDTELQNVELSDSINRFLKELKGKHDKAICKMLYLGYKQEEIAKRLGYANHSAVSKRLAYIRKELAAYRERDMNPPPRKPQEQITVRYNIIEFSYKRI